MQQMLFKGIKGSDLLEDITLRFRPYAVDRNQVEELKAKRLRALEKVVENGAEVAEMVAWGTETVAGFRKIKLRKDKRFPLVLYIGEIYMRHICLRSKIKSPSRFTKSSREGMSFRSRLI